MTPEELRNKYNPEGSDLRRSQLRMLEMLQFIDRVCREHGIDYWLDSGTLLGAARHQGFIPWDDDTDICMTYEGMLRFKEIMLTHHLSDEFVLQCQETDENIVSSWVILRDLKTEAISDAPIHNRYRYKGLNVDIFPVSNESVGLFHLLSSLYYKVLVKAPLKEKPLFKYIKFLSPTAYKLFYHVLSPCFRFLSKPFKKNYYRMTYGCEFPSRRYLADVWPLSRMEFEGCMLSVPGNTDAYLTKMYGNWRQMPREDQIQTHHYTIRFLDKPQPR